MYTIATIYAPFEQDEEQEMWVGEINYFPTQSAASRKMNEHEGVIEVRADGEDILNDRLNTIVDALNASELGYPTPNQSCYILTHYNEMVFHASAKAYLNSNGAKAYLNRDEAVGAGIVLLRKLYHQPSLSVRLTEDDERIQLNAVDPDNEVYEVAVIQKVRF